MSKITINTESLKNYKETKRFKIKDGSNIYRVLPPFGDVEVHNNYPYRKWSIVWLLDPKSGKRRPYASPMTDGTKECPVTEYNDALTKMIDNQKKVLEKKGLSKEMISKKLKDLYEIQWKIRVNHVYTYNVADKSGEVGLLEVKSTAHKGLKKVMNEYIKTFGQDPTCLESDIKENAGVWINIKKEGEGKDTEYNVDFAKIAKKDEDGDVSYKVDRSPLSENIVDNFDSLAYDLSTLYIKKSYEDLKEILLFNLAVLKDSIPACILEGYDVDDIDTSSITSEEPVEEVEEVVEEQPKKKSKITVQLDADDEEEAPKKPVKKPIFDEVEDVPVKKATKSKYSDKDVLAMAEDILS